MGTFWEQKQVNGNKRKEINMELPFERAAMKNEPLPDGMRQSDNRAYLALRSVYRAFKTGNITRETAVREKMEVAKAWENDKYFDSLNDYRVEFTKAIEAAASEYRKKRTIDSADRLIKIIDGIERPWVKH